MPLPIHKTLWKTFVSQDGKYSATATFHKITLDLDEVEDGGSRELPGEWMGEFNYPIRRFVAGFTGKTIQEAQQNFEKGVTTYIKLITKAGHEPEKQGLAGVTELLHKQTRSCVFQMELLDFPELPKSWRDVIYQVIPTSCLQLDYHQAALDELSVLLGKPLSQDKFVEWAYQTWHSKELARTASGLAISRQREEQVRQAV